MAVGNVLEMNAPENITRIRVTYQKGPSLRFTGHLDLQRLWERLLRRTKLPIRYSQGYHPRARLNLASALPLGFTSQMEMLDFWMDEPRPVEEIRKKIEGTAPEGIVILAVHKIDLHQPALQNQLHASEFEVHFFDPPERFELQEKITQILSTEEIIRVRRKKTYNLRPLILNLQVKRMPDDQPILTMCLLAEPGATGRPDEVLDELGYTNMDYLVCRTQLILSA
jgi:radical SAM-linked protein